MNAKKILVVEVNWLGDALFSTPLIQALKESNPSSRLMVMCVPRCVELLKQNPYVDEILVFDERSSHKGLLSKLKFVNLLKSKKIDEAYLLHRSMTRALIVFLASIKKRVGFCRPRINMFLTHRVKDPMDTVHRRDRYLELLKAVGIEAADKKYKIYLSADERRAADDMLSSIGVTHSDKLIAINAGGNWLPKRWPKENIVELIDEIYKMFNAKVILTGSLNDAKLIEEINNSVKKPAINLAGKTSITTLGAVFERCNVVISADSGPLHLASSVNTPVIALFGPTAVKITGPVGGEALVLQKDIGCKIPCYELNCPENKCMSAISAGDVLSALKKFL